jgi:HJR/Mrr/RecB family endonuclease
MTYTIVPIAMTYTVKPLYYVHTRDQKVSLYLLTRSLYLTWFVLNNEVHEYRKGPKFSVLINEVYLLKGPSKEVLLYNIIIK